MGEKESAREGKEEGMGKGERDVERSNARDRRKGCEMSKAGARRNGQESMQVWKRGKNGELTEKEGRKEGEKREEGRKSIRERPSAQVVEREGSYRPRKMKLDVKPLKSDQEVTCWAPKVTFESLWESKSHFVGHL